MPNRLVHGERVWRSEKLLEVEPESFRAEFANLLPLALANGVFECNARKIFSDVYSFNRSSFAVQDVDAVLAEFERVKLLFRWKDTATGKTHGFWTGIRNGGLLPSPEECCAKRYKVGPEPPPELLERFLAGQMRSGLDAPAPELPTGTPQAADEQPIGNPLVGKGKGKGVGVGTGKGNGTGVGSHENRDAVLRAPNPRKVPFKKKKNLTNNLQELIKQRDGSFASHIGWCQKRGQPHPFDAGVQAAFKAMEYEPDFNDPLLTQDFVAKVESIYEVHCKDSMTPALLCTKVMDSCERERKLSPDECYFWPPSFEEHRDRLRAAERDQTVPAASV